MTTQPVLFFIQYEILMSGSVKLIAIFILLSFSALAQDTAKYILAGVVKDAENGETLIGASVMIKAGVGVITDLDGNFRMRVEPENYELSISYVGYATKKQKVKIKNANLLISVLLESNTLDEVEVVANIAQIRETPVAFSSISQEKIQQELGSRDISMIANTTPGAYASSSGGGAGDSRVTIRGFDQTNIGVLVDGIPVNDMENGQVFWSNWDGLKEITRSMQIQRGLGASKLAITSVGGTMNFITNGIDQKQQTTIKKEWGNNGYSNVSLGYNSGLIKNKWGITLAGSYKTGNGWVDQTWTEAWSYFGKIQYRPTAKHLISIGANAAPQKHGQRLSKMPIVVYDKKYAEKLGVNADSMLLAIKSNGYTTPTQGDRDLRWNPDMGMLNGAAFNDKINYFNKPLFNLSHFWSISEKHTLSTVAYASIGHGGGTSYNSAPGRDTTTGWYNVQQKYNTNSTTISSVYSKDEHKSSTYLRSANNDHHWFGLLSTATSRLNKMITLTYGLDLRYYRGFHTTTVYDLIGGDYATDFANKNIDPVNPKNFVRHQGDTIVRNYNGLVKWGGLFTQAEFKQGRWVGFVTATTGYTGYKRIDYFQKEDIVLPDTTLHNAVGYLDSVAYQGTYYKHSDPQARTSTIGWKWFLGYTVKGGANYNIDDHQNVFMNVGAMSIAPKFANVFDNSNNEYHDVKNQEIQSYELGYGVKYSKFYVAANVYYTLWNNKPYSATNIGTDKLSLNINGINLINKGIEFEGNYKPFKQIEVEGVLSLGDWIYNSSTTVYLLDNNGNTLQAIDFSAKGVHLSDAA
ncbi:MAG: carboxypeptidase-like regulatory domain-containing protein, partial [Bacteroidia bacterium]